MNPRVISFFGLFVMLFIAYLFSNNKRKIDFRVIAGGLVLQFTLAFIIIHTQVGQSFFKWATESISSIVETSDVGSRFVFGEKFHEHLYA